MTPMEIVHEAMRTGAIPDPAPFLGSDGRMISAAHQEALNAQKTVEKLESDPNPKDASSLVVARMEARIAKDNYIALIADFAADCDPYLKRKKFDKSFLAASVGRGRHEEKVKRVRQTF